MKSTRFALIFFSVISFAAAQSDPTEQPDQTVDPGKPFNAIAPIPQCKINEKYTICGTPCEPSCDIPNPTGCPKICVRACQCISGYYRNKEELCVKLSDCPKKDPCALIKCKVGYTCKVVLGKAQCLPGVPQCKPNESYLQCGTACEPSCDKPKPGACTRQCVIGCQCNGGYYRNKQGNCVKLTDCPPNDPLTCATVLCKEGYTCTEASGKPECVLAPKCKPNETYQTCGTPCELSCDNPLPVPCFFQCIVGCQCNSGYYRTESGDCVKLADCPPKGCKSLKCVPPEVCALTIPFCPLGHCSPQPTCVSSNPCLWTKCKAGQECVLRQVICVRAPCNPVAECIDSPTPPTPTFDPACPQNEEYLLCKNACSEKKCGSILSILCPLVCTGDGGCACKSGYYRNTSGKCVTLKECIQKID